MLGSFLLFLAVGKLIIFAGQSYAKDNRIEKGFIGKLLSCDWCLGVWVYVPLALLVKMTILQDIFPYMPFLSEAIAGIASSFVMHIFSIGWREKFSVIVIE